MTYTFPVWNREWSTTTVVRLLRHIWATYDWSLFPIVADALQDAGFDKEEWLNLMRTDCTNSLLLMFLPIVLTEGT